MSRPIPRPRQPRSTGGDILNARFLVGLAISVALLYVLFRSVDFGAMAATFGEANYLLLVPATAVYFVGVWLRAARWRQLMAPFAQVSTGRLFRVIVIGFAVNNVLPLRLGELVRTFILRHSDGVPVVAALASILLERVLDVVTLAVLLVAVSWLVPLDGWLAGLATLSWLVATGALVGLLVLVLTPGWLLRRALDLLVALSGRLSARLGSLVSSFLTGLGAVQQPRALLGVAFLSLACWVAELGLYYFMMLAFGFDSGVLSLVAGMVVANLATVVPSSPGYVGTFDVPLQSVLTDRFGVNAATATSYTLLTHAVLLVPVVVLGLFLLSRENLSLRSLGRGKIELRRGRSRPRRPHVQSVSE